MEADIKRAQTLPSHFYTDEHRLRTLKETVLARTWQFLCDLGQIKAPQTVLPVTLLQGCLDEPLLLTRDSDDNWHCLSNVCTHRGNLLVEGHCTTASLRCRYHGRRFALDGSFSSAPGFEEAKNFPGPEDDLSSVPAQSWKSLLFACASRQPLFAFDELLQPVQERLHWLDLHSFKLDESSRREYLVQANWALYCENYLEGFHIPYVHPQLAAALDVRQYKTEIHPFGTLQIGIANTPQEAFQLPRSSPDYGQLIAAYYFFLFPNLMLNFYPWGLSINIVVPLEVDRCKVIFLSYVHDQSKRDIGAGAALDRVEREDEDIVEKVQKGMQSRFYKRGRYSPQWEEGVHHFHRLLTKFSALDSEPPVLAFAPRDQLP